MEKILSKYNVKFVEAGSNIIAIKIFKGKNYWVLADSYKLLDASLDILIDTFKSPYKKIPIDFDKKHYYADKKLTQHLENDCKSLFHILEQFQNEVGELKLTIASQALEIFKSKFFNGELIKLKGKDESSFRKKYYHGGRVEVFKGFGVNLNYYDINSLYPFVMCRKMPCGRSKVVGKYDCKAIGFYDIKLKSDTDFYVSPLIKVGKFTNQYINGKKGDIFNVSNIDIEYLKKHKVKFEVIRGITFKSSDYLFKDFIEYYYQMKKENKGNFKYFIAKKLMNSLYGKMGQKIQRESLETWHGQTGAEIYDAEYNLVLVKSENKSKFHLVYIAAYITSLARMELLNLINRCKESEIYYCDTDSLITKRKLPTSDKIGDIKLEHRIKRGVFLLPKTYFIETMDGKEIGHLKGFKSHNLKFKNLLKSLQTGKAITTKRDDILSFRQCLTRVKGIKSEAGAFLKIVEQKKTLNPKYLRRQIIPSKKYIFDTKPLNMEN
jgi:hypothetical protein